MVDKVIVEDIDVDAAFLSNEHGTMLVLRPTLTFSSAVRAIRHVDPSVHPDVARSIVREHLPNATEIETLIGDVPPIPTPRVTPAQRRRSRSAWAAGVLAAAALVTFGTIGLVRSPDPAPPSTRPSAAPVSAPDLPPNTAMRRDATAVRALSSYCIPVQEAVSNCSLPDLGRGVIEIRRSSDGAFYRMDFGDESAMLRTFNRHEDAVQFVATTSRMYTHLQVISPYGVVTATSKKMLHDAISMLAAVHGPH